MRQNRTLWGKNVDVDEDFAIAITLGRVISIRLRPGFQHDQSADWTKNNVLSLVKVSCLVSRLFTGMLVPFLQAPRAFHRCRLDRRGPGAETEQSATRWRIKSFRQCNQDPSTHGTSFRSVHSCFADRTTVTLERLQQENSFVQSGGHSQLAQHFTDVMTKHIGPCARYACPTHAKSVRCTI